MPFKDKIPFGRLWYNSCIFLRENDYMFFKKVIDMEKDERRSYVRGDFSFKVDYKLITPEEQEDLNQFGREILPSSQTEHGFDFANAEIGTDDTTNTALINFLVQIDEKLNRVLDLLLKEGEENEKPLFQGKGLNISGSGMEMLVDIPIESGQVMHLKFLLSKLPYVFMDLFGEVIRVARHDKDGKDGYQLGIKFLNLSENERERIIASVFQRQREAIRKNKK
jgi:hypothetical protein